MRTDESYLVSAADEADAPRGEDCAGRVEDGPPPFLALTIAGVLVVSGAVAAAVLITGL